jgi:hypothetical protein
MSKEEEEVVLSSDSSAARRAATGGVDASDKGASDCPVETRVLIPACAATRGSCVAIGPRHGCQVGERHRQVGPSGGNGR